MGFCSAAGARDDPDPSVELAGEYRCKVLGLFGGADQAIPADAVGAFRDAWRQILEFVGLRENA